jgi:hypothetical protein
MSFNKKRKKSMDDLVECFPTGQKELDLVAASGYTQWPPRLTRFWVKKSLMDQHPIRQVGGAEATEWWIPAAELNELNRNIVGKIEVIGEYH